MSKSNAFRPSATPLEDRLALSGMTAWVAPAPAPPAAVAPQLTPPNSSDFSVIKAVAIGHMQADFQAFQAGYDAAVQSVLLAPNLYGFTSTFANRPAFDAQVHSLLTTLEKDLYADSAVIPFTHAGDYEFHSFLFGLPTYSTGLEGELDALPTPVSASGPYASAFDNLAAVDTAQTDRALSNYVWTYGQITPG